MILEYKRYFIEGRHDDSDSNWIEFQSDILEEIKEHYFKIVEENDVGQIYFVWDIINNEEIVFSNKKFDEAIQN